jgi:hypothetical protein
MCGKGGTTVRIPSGLPGGRTGTADCRAKIHHPVRPRPEAAAPAKDSSQPVGPSPADRQKGLHHPGIRCDETARRHPARRGGPGKGAPAPEPRPTSKAPAPRRRSRRRAPAPTRGQNPRAPPQGTPPDGKAQAKALRLPSPGRPRRHPPRGDDLADVLRHRREARTPGHPPQGTSSSRNHYEEKPPGHRHEDSHGFRRYGGESDERFEGHRPWTERATAPWCTGSRNPGTRLGLGRRTGLRPDLDATVSGISPDGPAPTALQAHSKLRRGGGRANGTSPDGAWRATIHAVTG